MCHQLLKQSYFWLLSSSRFPSQSLVWSVFGTWQPQTCTPSMGGCWGGEEGGRGGESGLRRVHMACTVFTSGGKAALKGVSVQFQTGPSWQLWFFCSMRCWTSWCLVKIITKSTRSSRLIHLHESLCFLMSHFASWCTEHICSCTTPLCWIGASKAIVFRSRRDVWECDGDSSASLPVEGGKPWVIRACATGRRKETQDTLAGPYLCAQVTASLCKCVSDGGP